MKRGTKFIIEVDAEYRHQSKRGGRPMVIPIPAGTVGEVNHMGDYIFPTLRRKGNMPYVPFTYREHLTFFEENNETMQSNHHCDHCGAPLPGYEPNTCCGSAGFAEATECGCGGPRERICADCVEYRQVHLEIMEARKMK